MGYFGDKRMNADSLLTKEERKAIIDKLVEHDAKEFFNIAIGEGSARAGKIKKNIRKLYNKWDDAKLMSVRFK
jgi:hypothetical protein